MAGGFVVSPLWLEPPPIGTWVSLQSRINQHQNPGKVAMLWQSNALMPLRSTSAGMQEQWGTPMGSKIATGLTTVWAASYQLDRKEGNPLSQQKGHGSHEKDICPGPILRQRTMGAGALRCWERCSGTRERYQ